MKFAYTATNKEGKTVQGIADATDRSSLLAVLHKQDLHPIVVKLAGAQSGKKKRGKKSNSKS